MRMLISAVALIVAFAGPASGQTYQADPVHSVALARIKHLDAAYFWARFNNPTGTFTLNPDDPTESSFEITIDANKVDTANQQRDTHLRSPDFFNVKEFPTITFKSTKVEKDGEKLKVTGDLTLLGQTKPVTATVETFGPAKGTQGETRAGVEATLELRRSEFGMTFMQNGLGDDVRIVVAIEGVQQ